MLIFEYGKRGDPTLHCCKLQAKHLLTKEEAETSIEVVKQLMKYCIHKLRSIVFIDEATVAWDFEAS